MNNNLVKKPKISCLNVKFVRLRRYRKRLSPNLRAYAVKDSGDKRILVFYGHKRNKSTAFQEQYKQLDKICGE